MTSRVTSQRAAVSSLSAALVHGPTRPARVVTGSRLGAYLLVDAAADGPATCEVVLPLLTAAALALPTAVRLPDDALPALTVGDRVVVGQGRIAGAGWAVHIVRTVRPSRVRLRTASAPPVATSLVALLETRLGLGPGLTPEADDEIAGHLLVAAGRGCWVPDLEPHLHRTTALSASLLRAAAQGYAAPVVVAYVDAVLDEDHPTAARLRPKVEAIGHTSGPALLRGIHAGAAADLHEPSSPARREPALILPAQSSSTQISKERTVA